MGTSLPVGIVVLNYNGLRDTLACLDSLAITEPAPQEVVLIDNGSRDESAHAFRERYGDVAGTSLICLKENLGYAGGMNTGIRHLLNNREIRVILLLNNDTTVKSDFLAPLMRCLSESSGYHLATPKILCGDGVTVWSAGERIFYPLLFALTCRGKRDGIAFDRPRKVNGITGCAMAVRREVFEKVGFFDENYFAYVEEVDLCLRALRAGFRIAYCPPSVVRHYLTGYLGAFSPGHAYLNARNKGYFIKKNISPLIWPLSGVWYCLVIFGWIIRALGRGNADAAWAVWQGCVAFLKGKMGPPGR